MTFSLGDANVTAMHRPFRNKKLVEKKPYQRSSWVFGARSLRVFTWDGARQIFGSHCMIETPARGIN